MIGLHKSESPARGPGWSRVAEAGVVRPRGRGDGGSGGGEGDGGAGGAGAPAARVLGVAGPAGWAADGVVTFAGRLLTWTGQGDQPAYLLPASAGHLTITVPPTFPWWRWGQLVLLLAVLFLAAPFGSDRSRRTS